MNVSKYDNNVKQRFDLFGIGVNSQPKNVNSKNHLYSSYCALPTKHIYHKLMS